ncbi:MAG: Ig-like domain-containing protein [bacterium]
MNKFLQRRSIRFPLIIALLLLLGGAGFFLWQRLRTPQKTAKTPATYHKLVVQEAQAQDHFILTPTESDALGVAPTTQFHLTSTSDVSCSDVASSLTIAPDTEVKVKTVSATACDILPQATLATAKVYRVMLGTTVESASGAKSKHLYQWAYQTKEELTVDGSLPRNKATGVPVDTGIEMTFTTDRVQDFSKHFSISPATEGRFEQHGRTWAFIPAARLQQGAVYTVTISAGLPVKDSSVTLAQDFVVRFETAAAPATGNSYVPPFSTEFTSVQPNEAPVLDFTYQTPPGAITATVYRFADADDLLARSATIDALPSWAYTARQNAQMSTDGLTKIGEFPLAIEGNIARFPSGFDRGYYLITFPFGGTTFQTPLVVSELSASLTLTKNTALVWIADLATNTPLVGATVKDTLGHTTATTDGTGVAQLATPPQLLPVDGDVAISRGYLLVNAPDGRQTLVPLVPETQDLWKSGMSTGGMTRRNDNFWTYFWTDRTLYRPTDTLNLWGVLKNREQEKSEHVTFEVWTWEFVDANGDYLPVATGSAETDTYGSFTASLPLSSLTPGYYTVSEKIGTTAIANRSFQVQTFTKPAYQILATTDKSAVIDGETVRYTIQTQFFDGTPAPSIKLHYGSWGQAGDAGTEITTDEKGRATFSRTLTLGDPTRHSLSFDTLMFFPAAAAEGDSAAQADVVVYPSAVTFSPTSSLHGETATVRLTLTETDVTATSSSETLWVSGSQKSAGTGKPVPNAPIEGTVYEIVTTKTKYGTQYDFLEKKVVDLYTYDTKNEKRENFTGTTDAQGNFSREVTLKGDAYLVDLSAKDAMGRTIVQSLYLYAPHGTSSSTTAGYTLRDTNPSAAAGTAAQYAIGDTTTLQFMKDGEPVANEGSFLYLKLQNGLREVALTTNSALDVTFQASDAPNVYYAAVWFHDGVFIVAGGGNSWNLPQLQLNTESRKLTVTVTPKKETYTPGETADLRVHVTDAAGKPVRAEVNLSIIDEALSVIQWENPPMPLSALYTPVGSGILQEYVSNKALALESGAEGGGGGGGSRQFFKDIAYFKTIETNKSGQADVSFTLPDNITSWRITSQAVTKDLEAGHAVTALPVTKPVFGLLTMSDEYVLADQPTVIGYAYGSGLAAKDSVQMTLDIPDLGVSEKRTTQPFAAQRFDLSHLQLGDHRVTLSIKSEKGSDTLVRTMTVLPSRLTKVSSTTADVQPGMHFSSPSETRSTLLFSDTGRGRILATLDTLRYSSGKRLDRSLAAVLARDALNDLGIHEDASGAPSLTGYQQHDGGIALMIYGDSDPRLSAFAAARGDLFDAERLRAYCEGKLTENNASLEQIGYALLGLANLNEPVLSDLERYLSLKGISDENRLIVALAYAALGSNDLASTIASPLLTTYGETQQPFIRLTLGSSADEKILHTAEFSILAEALKMDERLGLAEYLAENFPKDTVTNLERAIAMHSATPNLDDTTASFRYRLNGEEKAVDLSSQRTLQLSVTSEDLSTLAIFDVQGPVSVTQYTLIPLDVAKESRSESLHIDRSYGIYGTTENRAIHSGDIVKITLTPRTSGVLDQGFFATDELPSGLVLINKPWERGIAFDQDQGYPIEVDGQRVTFYTSGHKQFFYYARVLAPGGYAAEPALLQGEKSRDLVNYSGAQTLEIR